MESDPGADGGQPAGRVVALALDRRLEDYMRHVGRVRDADDPEHLHQARVALRRARSVAREAHGVVAAEELELLRALMGEVAGATSTARDLDVMLDALGSRLDALDEPLRVGGPALRDELRRRRCAEQEVVLGVLDGPLHAAMLRRWRHLANPYRVGGGEPGPEHLRPAGEVADARFRSAWRGLLRSGRRSLRSARVEDWHRTRRRAKRVRYLLDAYGDLSPAGTWRTTSKRLRRLQNALGELQDLEVGVALLVDAGRSLSGDGALTAGALAGHLASERSLLLDRTAEVWRRFDRPKVRRRFDEALERADRCD